MQGAGAALFIHWFNWAYLFMVQEREQCFLELLAQHGLAELKDKNKFSKLDVAMVICYATLSNGARAWRTYSVLS
jgi:hypothetical protein